MSLKIVVLAKTSARYQKCGEGCHERGRNDQPCRLACYLQPRRFECLGTGSATERTKPGIDDYPAYDGSSSCRRNYSGRFIPWSGPEVSY